MCDNDDDWKETQYDYWKWTTAGDTDTDVIYFKIPVTADV